MEGKVCTTCKNWKPASEMSKVRRGRDRKGPYHIASQCLLCVRVRSSAWKTGNRDRCLAVNAEWRDANREQHNAYNAQWRMLNRERHRKMIRDWCAKNVKHVKQKYRIWRLINRERIALVLKRWRTLNQARRTAYQRMRQISKSSATPLWLTAIQRAQIQEFYDVAAARTTQTSIYHHVDHVHPLRGRNFRGLHVPWNLQVLTAAENIAKNNHLMEFA